VFTRHANAFILASFVLFIIVLLTSIFSYHKETSEIIYQTLAVKLSHHQAYNLQNTQILKSLPKNLYDNQLFFYPPAFIIVLAFFNLFAGGIGFNLVGPLLYILTAITISKSVLLLTKSKNLEIKAFVISMFSSMLLFTSTKVLMDLFMVLMSVLSFYFLLLFREKNKSGYVFLSGLFLVLGILTKYVPVILLIFYLPLLFQYLKEKNKFEQIYLYFIPFLLIVFWLESIFKLPLSKDYLLHFPTKEMLSSLSFLNYAAHRPFYFYFLNIFLINPLYIFIFLLFKRRILNSLNQKYNLLFFIGCSLLILSTFTVLAFFGSTFQMRFILLAEPFLIILLTFVNFEDFKLTRILFFVFLIQNVLLFIFNTILLKSPEMFSLLELMKIVHNKGLG